MTLRTVCLSLTLAATGLGYAADFPLIDLSRLELMNAKVENTTYRGRTGMKMVEKDAAPGSAYAVLKGLEFHDGTIEMEVSGAPSKSADATARGFIGILFRLQSDGEHAESIYLRPSNGRADDQLMRNHSAQYMSPPDWGWKRLRDETPGQYESYVDLQPGEWTAMRVAVHGDRAELYVGAAKEPCLIVKGMKRGDSRGSVALWIGPGTEGYFRNVSVTTAGTAGK